MTGATTTTTLYERLGGAEGIYTDIVELHSVNPLIRTRVEGKDKAELRKLVAQFFSMGSGGPAEYEGRDMRTAHKGMNLDERELVASIDDVLQALDPHGIDAGTRGEVLAILYSLKDEVLYQ